MVARIRHTLFSWPIKNRRHGWSLDGVDLFELVPPETTLDPDFELTVLHPAEIELSPSYASERFV